ncbi:sulfoxide reductase heme-binding subunit YedZ [Methyloprofundus sedimenti]|uniref:Protein-methionine-sulfoxide reductase heme-binding subunit MsrQ n=1 Tax=Methyloprofundus sedimenti TaxID=1420851 RepID=A0A1V8M2W8_9GAMM|nr:protein-methionine-sulfoxide reductase heme-binding subunit MsrQ [Methyloprofundus sedimenti]OQK15907.1 sulfoxide reductase heme-binding subunit YedZ [Methyloprofundus sedimenti]
MPLSKKSWAWIKMTVFVLSLAPFLLLVNDTLQNQLGANPIETLHFTLGDWALRFLCIGLALTPLKKLLHQSWPIRFRRMLGLFAYFYACLHFLVYIALDLSFSWENFIDEVPQSPYILVGLFTFILLTPLALTSTKAMQKRLAKRWIQLHKLVYLAAISAVIHYLWLVKSDLSEPLFYAAIISILLGFHLLIYFKKKFQIFGIRA